MGNEDPGAEAAAALLEAELFLRRYGLSASSCGAVRFRLAGRNGRLAVTRDGRDLPLGEADLGRIRAATGFSGGPLEVDGINVQVAGWAAGNPPRFQVMDFGRYRFASRFRSVLYSWTTADYESLTGIFLRPDHPAYVQPDPEASFAGLADHPLYGALRRGILGYERGTIDAAELMEAFNALAARAVEPLGRAPRAPARTRSRGCARSPEATR